jgi:hypothetical protein
VALPIAETLALQLIMIQWQQHVGQAHWADVSAHSLEQNLGSPWVLDGDDFWVNQFGHPYQGTWPYTAARTSGLGFWASVPVLFGASVLWEVGGETEKPAVNDQVTTTVGGVVLGEIVHRFAGSLRREGGAWRHLLAGVLEPMGAVNRGLVGPIETFPERSSRWALGLGTSFTGAGSGRREALGYGRFSFTSGLAGTPGLALERPFDHFVLEVDWTARPDPDAAVRARGLLAGATFEAGPASGLYGAFLSYDLVTPPGSRVSTCGLGFGGSARAELGGDMALEGDAVASAILMGAAGRVERVWEGAERDYRFGPGAQGLLQVRLLAGTRAHAAISVRPYLLSSLDAERGTELLVHGRASAEVRMLGPHGLGVEVGRNLRRAEVGDATIRQASSAVRVYYVLLGGG